MSTLETLQTRVDAQAGTLRSILEKAATEDRDLTDAEKANADELKRTIKFAQEQMDGLAEVERSMAASAAVIKNLPEKVPAGEVVVTRTDDPKSREELVRSIWSTPGEYMHDIIHAHQGDAQARERLARAIQHETTTEVPGLVPEPIIGSVVNMIDASRPIVSFLRVYGMPQYGSSFTRPKVVQHTQVDVQGTQKTELASRQFTVDPIQVNKVTMGGSLNIAFQVVDWTQPSALNAITDDLADQYAIQTEASMGTLIWTAASVTNAANAVTPAGADAADYTRAFAEAAGAVYEGCKRLPNAVFCAPDAWAWLIGMSDTTGRPVIASTSPSNAMGNGSLTTYTGSILGMPLVVSPGLPAGSIVVGSAPHAEAYEDRRGALRVVEPKLLGWEIAYYGYFAGVVTEAAAFVEVELVTS